jgi:hypothetical protein
MDIKKQISSNNFLAISIYIYILLSRKITSFNVDSGYVERNLLSHTDKIFQKKNLLINYMNSIDINHLDFLRLFIICLCSCSLKCFQLFVSETRCQNSCHDAFIGYILDSREEYTYR